ncbi:YncE family protein [Mycobacterium vicinigordonae]|uniref:YncE family protein n=1 Tax=Mycobacterium vicinigordonae TaxID=1719132 RepID=A0A7D6I5V2_9MYCO|nr:YncE family protein [Mycobacterium vicinigordonae]QLL06476.1 YncE family protein [Mycobacterium vicinigordonae]
MSLGKNQNSPAIRDVEVLDIAPAAVQIPVRKGAIGGIAISPDGRRLVVTNYGADSVSIIDTQACRVVETIPGVDEPFAIALASADRTYVTSVSTAYDSIQVVDCIAGVVVATHPVALSVSDLAVSADGKHVYIARNGARNADIAVLDTDSGQMRVIDIATSSGTATECVRVSPDGDRLYVGVNGPAGGQVVILDTGLATEESGGRSRWRRKNTQSRPKSRATNGPAVIGTIDIGQAVRDVAVSPNGALVYVASSGPDFAAIDVVDTGTDKITATRKITELTGLPTRLTLSGDGDRAYLVSDDSVTVLCTLTQDVVDSIDVGTQPSCVVESPDGNNLYIADHSGVITVAPVGAGVAGIEQAALEAKRPADLFMPDLLQYDAALV